ncbi:MAG TPA: DUF58 domain-containing protein [Anaerolineae bacterium]|nr:DUF58 domain-containing protein [Anaerolineae bacterium]
MRRNRTIVFLLWLVVGAGAIGTGREVLYNLWYLLTALILFSYLWAWSGVRRVRVERQLRTPRSQVGGVVEERLLVHNRSRLPKLWLEVRDHSTLPYHQASRVISPLGPRRTFARTVQTRCVQRGRFRLGPLTLVSGDPFGLFTITRPLSEPPPTDIIIYPATVDLPAFAPPTGFMPGGDAMHRRTHYITTNVSGVRDYAPGDSFNRIHWPSTARTGRLISKEFELDPIADVWLFLDLEQSAQSALGWPGQSVQSRPPLPWESLRAKRLPPSTVEYGVTIAASLARHFIARDRSVGLIAYSRQRQVIPADRGERQLTKILEMLAVVQAEGRAPLAEVLAAEGAHLARNSTAVIITPTEQGDWVEIARDLDRRGVRAIVVLLDSQSFGGLYGNADLVTRLAASGIPAYRVREGDDLAQALTTRVGRR